MMPIINIHPHPSESEAEAFRLTLKDADKFGLYCCHDGTSAMWSVIPKIALELIFNAETALPVIERTWVELTDAEIFDMFCVTGTADADINCIKLLTDARRIEAKLKEKNT